MVRRAAGIDASLQAIGQTVFQIFHKTSPSYARRSQLFTAPSRMEPSIRTFDPHAFSGDASAP